MPYIIERTFDVNLFFVLIRTRLSVIHLWGPDCNYYCCRSSCESATSHM